MENRIYEIRSTQKNKLLLILPIFLLGLLLIYLTNGKKELSDNYFYAYLLGLLLTFLGVIGVLMIKETSTIINPLQRRIIYQTKGLFNSDKKNFTFEQIKELKITRVGKASNFSQMYFLNFILKDNITIHTDKWSFDLEEIATMARDLSQIIGCEFINHADYVQVETEGSEKAKQFMLSFILSVILYIIYYRVKIGPLFHASWYGTLPPIFILVATLSINRILNSLRK